MKKIIVLLSLFFLLSTNVYSYETLSAFDDANLFVLNEELRRLSRDISPVSTKNWAQNMTFSATDGDTVAWTTGSFVTSDGLSLSISAGNTGDMTSLTYIYVDMEASLILLQTTTSVSAAVGDNKILIAIAENNDDDATFQVMGGRGGIMISEADITVTDLSEISVDVGTITAGSITGTTIQTATGNPKIVLDPDGMTAADGLGNFVFEIETTGDDVGDVTLGQYDSNKGAQWDESEEAFNVKGVITATAGTIGGFTINASELIAGSGDNTVGLIPGSYPFYAGDSTPANAEFSVSNAGALKASSGTIGGWTLGATTIDSGEILIDAGNDKIETSDYVSGYLGSGWHIGNDIAEFNNIRARGKISTSVFEKDTISVVGGNFMVMPGDILDSDMTALDASTMTISGDETFAVNDILRIKDGTDDEWFTVTNADSAPTYTVTRDQASQYSANTNPIWTAGTSVVNYGATGEGGVYLSASEANSPYIHFFTHEGSPWTTTTAKTRIGKLDGIPGASGYGIWGGDGYLGQLDVIDIISIGSQGEIRSNTTGSYPYLSFSSSGLQLKDSDPGGTYGTAVYGTDKYGYGALAWIMNTDLKIP